MNQIYFLRKRYNYIGDDTAALLLHLKENEGEVVGQFYRKVIQFYQDFEII